MKLTKKRVALNDDELIDLTLLNDNSVTYEMDVAVGFTLLGAVLSEALPSYATTRYSHPCGELTFQHAESDCDRVLAMFSGDFSTVSSSPSATLDSNYSKGVSTLLSNYYSAATRAGLITAPRRLRAYLRFADGTRLTLGDPVTLFPATAAPMLIIRDYADNGTQLNALIEIYNTPKQMMYQLSSLEDYDTLQTTVNSKGSRAVAIDFYATKEVEMAPASVTCDTPCTYTVDGERLRGIPYDSYAEATVISSADADKTFSLLGSLKVADMVRTTAPQAVPLTVPDEDEDEESEQTSLHVMTSPLDLGDPESEKRVRGVALRGIFQHNEVTLTLYGSHHRENWRKLATSNGSELRFLYGIRYRWYRVEIEVPMRSGDKLDAISFTYNKV